MHGCSGLACISSTRQGYESSSSLIPHAAVRRRGRPRGCGWSASQIRYLCPGQATLSRRKWRSNTVLARTRIRDSARRVHLNCVEAGVGTGTLRIEDTRVASSSPQSPTRNQAAFLSGDGQVLRTPEVRDDQLHFAAERASFDYRCSARSISGISSPGLMRGLRLCGLRLCRISAGVAPPQYVCGRTT